MNPEPLRLRVTEARTADVGRTRACLDPADMARLGVGVGDIVELVGARTTVAKVWRIANEYRGQGRVQIDGLTRENAQTGIDQLVELRKSAAQPALKLALTPDTASLRERDVKYLASLLDGLAVLAGDRVRVTLFGSRTAEFHVTATTPAGPVLIGADTELDLGRPAERGEGKLAYEDIGGLKREIARVREMIELPLRYPEVFERLGVEAPKGVLLHGPPGCGKTLIARAVASETNCYFRHVNGPELIDKWYGTSEANLRGVFEDAQRHAPAIIFIDEIDAIAPKREDLGSERQAERRVVAQLLTLLDGLTERGHVVVIAATNIPNSLDPALRRPGRFDRELIIPIPDKAGRREILEVHTRGMPLAADVSLNSLAGVTHGFVGADLAALCREAAMSALRRFLPQIDFATAAIPFHLLQQIEVRTDDFRAALREVEPSALREVTVEVPDVKWEDVGGLSDVKRRIVEAVEWPLRYPKLFRVAGVQPPKGVLLSGPPGCGKTLLAKAAASQTGVNFIAVKGPALLSKWVGESEKAVREVFRKARQAAPCILFFDEIDSLAPSRGGGPFDAGVTDRVVAQLLAELDGVEERAGVLVLGATNRPDRLDPALMRPGRFDLHIQIPLPDRDGRQEIFRIYLKGKPLAEGIDPDTLAERTEGYSGAEIAAICTRAALEALREAVGQLQEGPGASPSVRITAAHLEGALREARPPVERF